MDTLICMKVVKNKFSKFQTKKIILYFAPVEIAIGNIFDNSLQKKKIVLLIVTKASNIEQFDAIL